MVLESLFSAKKIESKPIDMLVLSIIVSMVCVFLAYAIFPEYAGIIIPLLITIAMTPVIIRIFKEEEEIEREEAEGKIKESFLERHGETVYLFSLFFIGVFISLFIIAIILPENLVTGIFSIQLKEITAVKGITGAAVASNLLEIIILNNLKIMFFSFILSFAIGTGALFILSWNASILALYLANFIRKGLTAQFVATTAGILPHAPVEILAYFLAGIAGGILSVGVIRENLRSKEFSLVFKDSLIMLFLSVIAVVLGAFLEIYL